MKKTILLSVSFVLLFFVSSFSQEQAITLNKEPIASEKKPGDVAIIKSILQNNGYSSSTGKAPQGYYRYTRTVYIITAAEIASAGATSGIKFTSLGFNYTLAQNTATTGSLKIYLQNSSDIAFSKTNMVWSDSSTGIIDNMTLVHDGTVTIPAATGPWDIILSNGSAFTYTGGALYVAFDYQNPTGTKSPSVNSPLCNYGPVGGSNGLRNAYSSTALPTTLNYTAALRPETRARWISGVNNDAKITNLYSFGKLPINGLATGNPISAVIVNNGDADLTNLKVTLNITGANAYTATQVIPLLAEGNSVNVSFTGFSPSVIGVNTVTISVPDDGNNSNNSLSSSLTTTDGTYAYQDAAGHLGGLGNSATTSGLFLAKYYINGTANINSTTVTIAGNAANTGQIVYGVLVDTSGTILATSPKYTILSTDNYTPVTFTFPTAKKISNQYIYVGLAQTVSNTTAQYFPLALQTEDPARSNAYYAAAENGEGLTEILLYNRFMIEANVTSQIVPVELTSFTSTVNRGIVTLKWSTATETNNAGYDIEKSSALNSWVKAGSVGGHGTTGQINHYSYTDDASKSGATLINYRLKQIDFDGSSKYYYLASAIQLNSPKSFELLQNYPNPFNPNTSIRYSIPTDSKVKIDVYDNLGRMVTSLVNEFKTAGSYTVSFDASALASGIYLYKISAGNFTATKKMSFLK